MNEERCPICGLPFMAGERRVSWFAKVDEFTTERGAIHLSHLTT